MVQVRQNLSTDLTGLKRYTPFLFASGVLLTVILWLLVRILEQNGGQFTYLLDDPYIHMAMAKNVAHNGVWGVTRYEFSSSSSSLLWTLLLSGAYAAFGPTVWMPFLLNIGCALLLLFGVHRILLAHDTGIIWTGIILLLVVFVTPLPILIFGGQEHILHALLTSLFVYLASRAYIQDLSSKVPILLLVVASFVTMARYEGVFLIVVVSSLLWFRDRPKVSAGVILSGAIPVAAYGVYSLIQGWYVLPNSVLLKGDTPDISSILGVIGVLGFTAFKKLRHVPALWMILAGAFLVLHLAIHHRRRNLRIQFLLITFLGTSALHLQFARIGWSFRYEAYLTCLGLVTVGLSLSELNPNASIRPVRPKTIWHHRIMALLVLFASLAFLRRGMWAWQMIPGGTHNVYDQQYQVAQFLDRFYEAESVALNDIGAPNYYTDIRSLDMIGLSSIDVARARRSHTFDADWVSVSAASRNVEVAVVYESWLGEYIPSHWVKVGEWQIQEKVTAGDDTVAFYAPSSTDATVLAENLASFASRVPADVTQRGRYIPSSSRE